MTTSNQRRRPTKLSPETGLPAPDSARGVPPAANRLDCELGGVSGIADRDPVLIIANVADPIGDRFGLLTERGSTKSSTWVRSGSPIGAHPAPLLASSPIKLHLLRGHAYHRLTGINEPLGEVVEVPELAMTIGVLTAFGDLVV